jgi:hypothetical protein
MEKTVITADLQTTWTPDVEFNKKRPPEEKVEVTVKWPTVEEFDLIAMRGGDTAPLFHQLTRKFCTEIKNFSVRGAGITTGAELTAVRSKGAAKARSLSINIGSYIFEQSLLSEEEEKN